MKKIVAVINVLSLTACSSIPTFEPEQLRPAPEFANVLNESLRGTATDPIRILECSSVKATPSYFVCKGEYSVLTTDDAKKVYREAITRVLTPGVRVQLAAERDSTSRWTVVIIRAVVVGTLNALAGGGSAVAGSSPSDEFTFIWPET